MQKKTAILSQKTPQKTRAHRVRWLLALSSLPLFGIVTAFGVAPGAMSVNVPTAEVAYEVALPEIATSTAPPHQDADAELIWHLDETRRGDTLESVLDRLNIHNADAITYLRHAPDAKTLSTDLGPGRTLLSKTTQQGDLIELQFHLSAMKSLVVRKTAGHGYTAETLPMVVEKRVLVKTAEIESSLFASTDAAGIPDQIATKIADIFSSEIDFNLDLRKGDHFTVIYEAAFNNGELVKAGRVLAAEFVNKGRALRGIAFGGNGSENYYSPAGVNLQKAFLRSPLEFSRISSGFSLARLHPVLQTLRAHKGVDYAAPIGTRVKAVADATVSFVGSQGGYGNVVVLQHNNGISTAYGHLSKFAPGIKRGQPVHQGDIVGLVGRTGMATGPHLHYEFRIHGEHRDPLKVALPTAIPLQPSQLATFATHAAPLTAQLDMLRGTDLAALE